MTGADRRVRLPLFFRTERIGNYDKNYAGSLLQVKLAGDIYTGCYSPGVSMYQSVESLPFYYSAQSVKEEGDTFFVITEFKDDRGLKASHFLKYRRGERSRLLWKKTDTTA